MQRTPFYDFHIQHGAKMVDFAGWQMPLLYTSIMDEHHAVRNGAGLFDVSHMGRIKFTGRHARRFLEHVLTRRVSDMKPGQCRYSMICNDQGGVLDDVICYRFEDYWTLVVNASNREKLLKHFDQVKGEQVVKIEDQTAKTAMVACQGPKVMDIIGNFSREIPTIKRYSFVLKNLLILKLTVSRTGYTGEDGVEVMMNAGMITMLLKLLIKEGRNDSLVPCGLGARDTLRLEAGMPLYGHELSEQIDPFSAGLDFAVSLDKDQYTDFGGCDPFIGQEALARIKAAGVERKLVGLQVDGKRTPRQGAAVCRADKTIGEVTSGCLSPTLGYPIAMAYVPVDAAEVGTTLNVAVGKTQAQARIVPLPFYQRPADQ